VISNARNRLAAALAAPAAAAALLAPAAAPAAAPDRPFSTPVVHGTEARAAVSAGQLQGGINRALRRSGGQGGAYVADPATGAVLYSRGASRGFQIASNMKLFTTAAALARIGPAERFETVLIAPGGVVGGVVQGDLILRGGGDPGFGRAGVSELVSEARAAGVGSVTGRLLYDETIFDRRRSVPRKGIRGGPFEYVGRLSGLSFEGGRSPDPALAAAQSAVTLLRRRGVSVSKEVARGTAPAPTETTLVAEASSAPLFELARLANTFSSNFHAEMLLKALGAHGAGRGTTAAGAAVARSFAAEAGARLRAHNGSGLSRADRASPRSVGALLGAMLREEEPTRAAFIDSLAVAGRTGTLARRMRGTAAGGRCIGKTGTLDGVSALSGYCLVAPERLIVFSVLMNKVSVSRAHRAQDRIVSLVAGYTP
jgi:serine-type D-Ala-D-Ala carboxypeptidase/endopeptidase (penicillin-binding protein 4)